MEQQARPLTLSFPANDGDHLSAAARAKVSLIEYGDFEGDACGRACRAVSICLANPTMSSDLLKASHG